MKIINHNNFTLTKDYKSELKNYNPLDLEDYDSLHIGELYNNYV